MSERTGAPLRVQLLGPVRVWRDGQDLPVAAGLPQAVLGVLATRSNSVVSRGELIDALWGEQPPASAENAVHVYVSRLRRLLEPDRARRAPGHLLLRSGSGYVLRLTSGFLDVDAFHGHREQAHRRRSAG